MNWQREHSQSLAEPTRHCIQCNYLLYESSSRIECPECGIPNPVDLTIFRGLRWLDWRIVAVINIVLVLVCITMVFVGVPVRRLLIIGTGALLGLINVWGGIRRSNRWIGVSKEFVFNALAGGRICCLPRNEIGRVEMGMRSTTLKTHSEAVIAKIDNAMLGRRRTREVVELLTWKAE
jgi:hypothetical protein